VSQPHTLLLDSTATWFGTVPLCLRARRGSVGPVIGVVDARSGEERAHGGDRCRGRRVPGDSFDRGVVIAGAFIHARISFVWFATRRALLGGD
jgi:hypothetical protein